MVEWPVAAERVVLLASCRWRPVATPVHDIAAALTIGLDWDALIAMARRHHVLQLVAHALPTCCPDLVPPATLDQLQGYFAAVNLRNTYMTSELLGLLDVLNAAAVRVIPFKGPTLALTAYGDVSLREFSDLDLLVTGSDASAAIDVLLERGYALDFPFKPEQNDFVATLTGSHRLDYLQSRSEHHLVRISDGMTVDLHVRLADPYIWFPVQFQQILQRSRWIDIQARRVPIFSPEDTLLMLSLNGAKDGWERLQRIADVAALLDKEPELDQEQVLACARRLGAVRMLNVSLILARELLGVRIPDQLASRVDTDSAARSVARDVLARLFQVPEPRPELSLTYARAYVRTRERLHDRLWFYLYLLFTPGLADWQVVQLPRKLRMLYYVIRPLRLIMTYGFRSSRSRSVSRSKSRPVSSR